MTLWEYLKEYLNFSKHFKELFAQAITDEEINKEKWVLCPKCKVNITLDDICGNDGLCPNCGFKIKTGVDVVLLNAGYNKIDVLKEIRSVTGWGLVESKSLLENTPKEVVCNVTFAEAELIKQTLENCGAEVEIR